MSELRYRACNLCEAICGLEIELVDGRVARIRGDRADPLSRGHVCPKALALKDIQEDPDRLRAPLRRDGAGWRAVGWDEALDEAAARIRAIQRAHGRDAFGVYVGNPNVHNVGALLFGPPLLRALRTKNRYSATSVDQLPHQVVAAEMFGHQLLLPIPDLDRTQHLLILGANPLVSNGSLMTAPDVARRLADLRARGGQVIVVDPRRTETAAVADRHHFIRPGADALLLLAMLQVIFAEGLAAPGRLAPHLADLPELQARCRPFPPERVAARTGVDAATIRALARDFARASSAICYGRMGLSTQAYGTLCMWLISALHAVTGNLDRAGGVLFTRPAIDVLSRTGRGRADRFRSRVRGLPEFGGELPVAALAEEILTPGEGQIRGLLTIAGNPVLSTPNGRALDQALAGLEAMIAIDFYLNETTRHAHLILPPTAPLEHEHYDLIFNALAIRNYARFSPAIFDPGPDARHDWQIMLGLQRRLAGGGVSRLVTRLGARALARLGPRPLLDLGLRFGPYGRSRGLSLRRLERELHGVDLGPLAPSLPAALRTKSGLVELAPARCLDDLARLEAELEAPARDGLVLIGRRQLRSNNSWLHNSERLVKGKERCTLLIHPGDAARQGIAAGDRVVVRSRVGAIE
ncbi:MAG: molybdopterin-dependent oxidoreductase, partial [Myxococcales bacterium]|nr:molybdopterin-dependent oxidoreductase [Myxococcales bacterium]